jgi:hypothetical protein
VQDEIVMRVVGAIAPQLEKAEIARAKRRATGDPAAYDLYLRGLAHWNRWSREGNAEALKFFYAALRLKPQWLPALRMAVAANAMLGQQEEAAQALADYSSIDPDIGIDRICDFYPLQRAADRDRLAAALRKAGLRG